MQYVMSDLHGRYDLFEQMLGELRFSDADTLYFLGDAVDRGPDGIRLVQDLMRRGNVMPLLGNHEDMFRQAIRAENMPPNFWDRMAAKQNFRNWTENNGGEITWKAYCALPEDQRLAIARWLEDLPLYYEVRVGGRDYLLAHAGVGSYAPEKDLSMCSLNDFIWGRMDYSRIYYQKKYLVTGHTPTAMIDPSYRGRIWRGNRHIAIDCGAVFFDTLGCLCLDTMERIYVCLRSKSQNHL